VSGVSRLIGILLPVIIFTFVTTSCKCKSVGSSEMKNDYAKIDAILDKALLSDNPHKGFQIALPEVKKFQSVDTAWINGNVFSVKFKMGGTVTWIITDDKLNKLN